MALEKSEYDSRKMDNLLQVIQSAWNSGQKQDYEIFVDNLKVVNRTADPQMFASHTDFINEDSKLVVVSLFKGGSRNNDKYFFYLKGFKKEEQPLSGLSENTTLAEHDAKQRERIMREVRLEELEKENAKLKTEVEEKQSLVDQLSNRLQELYDGKLMSYGEIGSAIVMRLLQSPQLRQTFPVLEGLVGTKVPETKIAPDQEATFTRKGEKTPVANEELTDEEQRYLLLIQDLQERLSPFQLSSVMHILDILTRCPDAIGSTLKHLMHFLDCKQDSKDDEKI
jgi:hypothetical protein